MATKIIHKKSSVADRVPVSADLEAGELALNLADRKIYSKQTDGTIVEMAPNQDQIALTELCKNVSGGQLLKGTVVYQSGTAGNAMEVQAADNSTASTMPAIGILKDTLADDEEGEVVLVGLAQGINTAGFGQGDTLYVNSSGGLRNTPPSGQAKFIQNIGKVIKVHATNGSVMVTGAGRSNATPNLNDGNIFIGNSSGQASIAALADEVDDHTTANGLTLNGWTVTESGGALYFTAGGTHKMKLHANGDLDVAGAVNGNATIT